MKKIINSISIFHLLYVGLILRVVSYYFYGDYELTNEWGILVHNKEISNIFGYYVISGENGVQPKLAESGEIVLPSVYMPPLYYYFIYSLKILSFNFFSISKLIIIFQLFLSLVSIFLFFKICNKFTEKNISLIFTSIFAFFPINVLAASKISSITLQIFLLLNFFFFLTQFLKSNKQLYLYIFSIFSGLLILIRGEFILFYVFTLLYFFIFYKKKIKIILFSSLITLITISPYLNRNYVLFETLTLTKSFGYNLLKGNNPNLKVEGDAVFIEKEIPRSELKIETDNKYEINLDNLYKERAIEFIKKDPIKYIKFYWTKVMSILFLDFNSTYPNYYNFFHILPKIILSIISLVGAIMALRKKGFFQYLAIYYFANVCLFSIFFILPRYSLILLPIQLILSINFIKYLFRKLLN
jgi:hypothetical protein